MYVCTAEILGINELPALDFLHWHLQSKRAHGEFNAQISRFMRWTLYAHASTYNTVLDFYVHFIYDKIL